MHVHELLQCANDHVVTNVITTKNPGKQTQQSSTQLQRDHPTNDAQQETNRNENKTTSLSLMKPYWIQFYNILVCVTKILQQICVPEYWSSPRMGTASASSQADIQRST